MNKDKRAIRALSSLFDINKKYFPGLSWEDNYNIISNSKKPGYIYMIYNNVGICKRACLTKKEALLNCFNTSFKIIKVNIENKSNIGGDIRYIDKIILYSEDEPTPNSERPSVAKIKNNESSTEMMKNLKSHNMWYVIIDFSDLEINLNDTTIFNKKVCRNGTTYFNEFEGETGYNKETKFNIENSSSSNFTSKKNESICSTKMVGISLKEYHNSKQNLYDKMKDKSNIETLYENMKDNSKQNLYDYMQEKLEKRYYQIILSKLKEELQDMNNWEYDGTTLFYQKDIPRLEDGLRYIKAANELGFLTTGILEDTKIFNLTIYNEKYPI